MTDYLRILTSTIKAGTYVSRGSGVKLHLRTSAESKPDAVAHIIATSYFSNFPDNKEMHTDHDREDRAREEVLKRLRALHKRTVGDQKFQKMFERGWGARHELVAVGFRIVPKAKRSMPKRHGDFRRDFVKRNGRAPISPADWSGEFPADDATMFSGLAAFDDFGDGPWLPSTSLDLKAKASKRLYFPPGHDLSPGEEMTLYILELNRILEARVGRAKPRAPSLRETAAVLVAFIEAIRAQPKPPGFRWWNPRKADSREAHVESVLRAVKRHMNNDGLAFWLTYRNLSLDALT